MLISLLIQFFDEPAASAVEIAVLAAQRPSLQHSCGSEHRKTLLHPTRVVVNGQGQEPYSIGVGNASHSLVTLRADERCAGLAFVDLLLRSAGTRCHIPVSLCLRLQAQGICFTMGNGLFFQETKCLGGLLLQRVYACLTLARSNSDQNHPINCNSGMRAGARDAS
jgi:hypothetical protein